MSNQLNLFSHVRSFSAERYYRLAGDLFVYHGDYDAALHMIQKSLTHDADDVRSMVLKGDILFCLNRDTEALEALEAATQQHPHCPEAFISKACVLEELERFHAAIEANEHALGLITQAHSYLYPSVYDQLLGLCVALKLYRKAQFFLKQARSVLNADEYKYLQASYQQAIQQGLCLRQKRLQHSSRLGLKLVNGQV